MNARTTALLLGMAFSTAAHATQNPLALHLETAHLWTVPSRTGPQAMEGTHFRFGVEASPHRHVGFELTGAADLRHGDGAAATTSFVAGAGVRVRLWDMGCHRGVGVGDAGYTSGTARVGCLLVPFFADAIWVEGQALMRLGLSGGPQPGYGVGFGAQSLYGAVGWFVRWEQFFPSGTGRGVVDGQVIFGITGKLGFFANRNPVGGWGERSVR